MRRLLLTLAFSLPIAAQAQPAQQGVPLGQQVDSAVATISRVAVDLSNQIALDQRQIAALQQMVATLTKERDDLKAKPADAPR